MAMLFSLKGTGFSPYINPAKSAGLQPLRESSFKLTHYAESELAARAFHFSNIVSYAA
jgi:hypothetical protein